MKRGRFFDTVLEQFLRVRPGLVPLLVFTILLGLINLLVVNQKVVLYIFYLPVVFAAWMLPKRDAVGVAALGAVMVMAYAVFLPGHLLYSPDRVLVLAEVAAWGGILIVTAYLVSTLRIRTQEALRNLQQAYSGVLAILSKFIQTVDTDTEAHSVRVSAWGVCIGKELGLDKSTIEEIRIGGLLHDIGKVEVSVKILRKAAALSEEEQEEMRKHISIGSAMIKPVGGMLSHIADAIEAHHEKYDGSGYMGLKGEQIPLVARIIGVADVFDALLADRPYRKGMGTIEAMSTIVASAGSHFDPKVVAALQKIIDRGGEQAVSQCLQSPGAAILAM